MDIKDLLSQIEEEGISESTKKERIQQLQDFIKSHNEQRDDHGPAIIGRRGLDLNFPEND